MKEIYNHGQDHFNSKSYITFLMLSDMVYKTCTIELWDSFHDKIAILSWDEITHTLDGTLSWFKDEDYCCTEVCFKPEELRTWKLLRILLNEKEN